MKILDELVYYVYYNCPICERILGEIRGIMIA